MTSQMHHFVLSPHILGIIIVLAIWETIWRMIAFWKSARNHQLAWFIVMALVNTAGILEILYIAFFQRDRNDRHPKPAVKSQ
jgi:hypothetical protein